MAEHPIIFSGPMIPLILAGTKTVTRRLSKRWLRVKAGDRLWARETFQFSDAFDLLNPSQVTRGEAVLWLADGDCRGIVGFGWGKVRTPIFMPRWASRITLEATEDARLERLRDITEEESEAEGLVADDDFTASMKFAIDWNSLHKDAPWKSNPEVVRVAFRRLS